MAFKNINKATEKEPTYRCPCCNFKTLYGRAAFEICPVCYWEDNGQDSHDADIVRGGPNGVLSLKKARENFARIGHPIFLLRTLFGQPPKKKNEV
jgi:hypothetical protein